MLTERYEYTPYGQRTVFYSPGTNDTGLYSPSQTSIKVVSSASVTEPYGIEEFGHQGLMHDEQTGLVFDRSRYLSNSLFSFLGQDPFRYPTVINLYDYVGRNPINRLDPSGKNPIAIGIGVVVIIGAGAYAIYEWSHSGTPTLLNGRIIDMNDPFISGRINRALRTLMNCGFPKAAADSLEKINTQELKGDPTHRNLDNLDGATLEQRTVISIDDQLSTNDIAMELLGEYQRRQGISGDDGNIDLQTLEDCIKKHGRHCVAPHPWRHPKGS